MRPATRLLKLLCWRVSYVIRPCHCVSKIRLPESAYTTGEDDRISLFTEPVTPTTASLKESSRCSPACFSPPAQPKAPNANKRTQNLAISFLFITGDELKIIHFHLRQIILHHIPGVPIGDDHRRLKRIFLIGLEICVHRPPQRGNNFILQVSQTVLHLSQLSL